MEIRSKYQSKHYTEVVYNFDEYNCPYCGHWFMIDIDFCQDAPTEDYDDFVKIFCPYCGKSHRRAI